MGDGQPRLYVSNPYRNVTVHVCELNPTICPLIDAMNSLQRELRGKQISTPRDSLQWFRLSVWTRAVRRSELPTRLSGQERLHPYLRF